MLAAAAGVVALATSAAGIALISPPGDVLTSSWIGWRLVIPALVYFGLAARVFRSERHRDLSTCLWALGTAALLGAETLVVDGATWTVIAYAATATALALLAAPLREERLWWAGTAIVSATSAVVLAWFLPPSHFFAATAAPGAGLWVGLVAWEPASPSFSPVPRSDGGSTRSSGSERSTSSRSGSSSWRSASSAAPSRPTSSVGTSW